MSLVELGVRLAIVAIAIGVFYAVVNSVNNSIRDHYVVPVRAEYEVKLKDANDRIDAQVKVNDALKLQIDGVRKQVNECNDSVDVLKGTEKSNDAKRDEAVKAANDRAAKAEGTIRILKTNAKTPTRGDFCEQAKQADDTLSDIARRQRVRDAAREALGLGR